VALNPKTAAASRDLGLNAAFDVLNSGFLDVRDGSQPSDADTALGAQVLLAHLLFGSTAFAASSSGSKSANSITADSSADATGTASWMTLMTSGSVRKFDGSAGTSSANLILNTTSIVSAASVSCSSLTITQAA